MTSYYIKTFGCATNTADSERLATMLRGRGMKPAKSIKSADYVVINTCIVRESAENRVYGLLNNLKDKNKKIVVTGCLVGMATRDNSGKLMKRLREKFPMVDQFLPMQEVGFDNVPLRTDKKHALVPISNGCNNFCTYCVVPFTRGREVSRPYEDIIKECYGLRDKGYKQVTLLGQNVNSYKESFPKLLEEVAKMGFKKVDFLSSNPQDFSDELIEVIARNKNITQDIHLPVQSGDDEVLRRMNRRYTVKKYLNLVKNIKQKIKNVKLSTDVIVGFPGETEKQFQNTVDLCKKVGFFKAYISEYSDRPMTAAHKAFKDDISHVEKERRWQVLEKLINKDCGSYRVDHP